MPTRFRHAHYLFVAFWLTQMAGPLTAGRVLEQLDRGLVALHRGPEGVVLSWRLKATDSNSVRFHIDRQQGAGPMIRLTGEALAATTWYHDSSVRLAAGPVHYRVVPIVDGEEQAADGNITLAADAPVQDYLTVPLQVPAGYHANDASVGDLTGDGRYEIVVHMVGEGRDNSQGGITTPPIFAGSAKPPCRPSRPRTGGPRSPN